MPCHRAQFASAVFLAALSFGAQAAPEISRFTPFAVLPGKRNILTFSGSGLDNVSNLWTTFGGSARRIANTNSDLVSFEVSCPDIPAGIHALQLSGPEGASDFRIVLVDSLRPQEHNDKHQSATNAQPIAIPAAVDGVLKAEQVDYYSFTGRADEHISLEAIAQRLGSQMDPVITVLSAEGRELAWCDDETGVWRDARFSFAVPTEGSYILAVHDVGYGGGSAFPYRLRVTREPLFWFTFPLVDPAETAASFDLEGVNLVRASAASPANPVRPNVLPTVPIVAEREPNNRPEESQPVNYPVTIQGRFDEPRDADWFQLKIEKSQKIVFESQSRSLGSPCDLVLILHGADGTVLARSNSSLPGDAALTNSFADAGSYLIEVREITGAAQARAPYRLRIAEFSPGISASVEVNRLQLKPDGNANLKVSLTRFDYSGPVILNADATNQIQIENNLIAEKKNDIDLKLKVSGAKPGDLLHFKLFARLGTNETLFPVSTKPALQKTFPLMPIFPQALDGLISAGVKND